MLRRSRFSFVSFFASSSSTAKSILLASTRRNSVGQDNDEGEGVSSSPSTSSSSSSWSYAEVDERGKTELDRKYEETADRIQKQFQQPIQIFQPNSSTASSKECDFLIGFSQYKFSLRNSYRNTIALALNDLDSFRDVWKQEIDAHEAEDMRKAKTNGERGGLEDHSRSTPSMMNGAAAESTTKATLRTNSSTTGTSFYFKPFNIELSVAWKGRFALHRFRGCHKVVGVTLMSNQVQRERKKKANDDDDDDGSKKKNHDNDGDDGDDDDLVGRNPSVSRSPFDDSKSKQQTINELVSQINAQRGRAFLECGITRAVPRDCLAAGSASGSNNFSISDDKNANNDQFAAAVRLVIREVKSLSSKHRVVIVYNDACEKDSFDKLRPIIYSAHIAPLMINIDSLSAAAPVASSDEHQQQSAVASNFPESLADLQFQTLPLEPSEKRRIVLHALADFYFKSSLSSSSSVAPSIEAAIDEYGKRAMEREETIGRRDGDGADGGDGDDHDDNTQQTNRRARNNAVRNNNNNSKNHNKSTMKFPMIFINGSFFGTGSHLLRMQNEHKKLATLINRPADLKYKPFNNQRE